jgi:plastocyanin
VNLRGVPAVSPRMPTLLLPRPLRTALASVATALLVVALAACGSDGDSDTSTGGDTTEAPSGPNYGDTGGDTGGAEAGELVVVAKDFSLSDLTVAPGEEFTVDNQGGATHTFTADDGAFDSGEVEAGSQSDPVGAPDEPGAYPAHCEIHSSMTATLTVEG